MVVHFIQMETEIQYSCDGWFVWMVRKEQDRKIGNKESMGEGI